MSITHTPPPALKGMGGFAIASAIFLLVVFAALGVAMLVFSNNQQAQSANDVQGSRAYQAAKAGIEWALYRRLNAGGNVTYCQTSDAGQNVVMPSGTTLSPFTVTVTCAAFTASNVQRVDPVTGQPSPLVIRTIDSWACNQPNAKGQCPGSGALDYVQRHVQVTIQQSD